MNIKLLRDKYLEIEKKANSMSVRERVIGCVTVVSLLWIGVYALVMEPMFEAISDDKQAIADLNIQSQEEDSKFKIMQIEYSVNPNKSSEKRIQELSYQIDKMDKEIQSKTNSLIPSKKTVLVLQDILKAQNDLYLVGLEKIAPIAIEILDEEDKKTAKQAKQTAKSTDESDSSDKNLTLALNAMLNTSDPILSQEDNVGTVYKHGVKITLNGEYQDVLEYLIALETLDWKVYWKNFSYTVDNYPQGTAEIIVETIGFENGWIGV